MSGAARGNLWMAELALPRSQSFRAPECRVLGRRPTATRSGPADSPLGEGELAAELTKAIGEEFGLDVPVVVRTADELAAVLAADPLGHVATDPARYSVTFFAEPLQPERVAALPPGDGGDYVVRGRELYLWLPDGMQHSPMGGWTWDRLLGAAGTNRNWNTVRKLVELTR
ncbi:DUF1697 domain-containing protein [Blastococcus sp. HT6-30]|uniref:DUF1697 domain-containing protein n=1 Tax=Blastococcus sp. HT6-30 TaxID=3144843 RepID=UPI00321A0434